MRLKDCVRCGAEIKGRGLTVLCAECRQAWRHCGRCKQVKPLSAFTFASGRTMGWCIECMAVYNSERYHTAEGRRYHYVFHLRKKFGITREEAERLADARECEVCDLRVENYDEARRKLHVDHCHRTQRVRGVVCVRCNHALGMLDDARPDWIDQLRAYLAAA